MKKILNGEHVFSWRLLKPITIESAKFIMACAIQRLLWNVFTNTLQISKKVVLNYY